MASIEKRGENAYRITVSDGYNRDGKKVQQKKTVAIDPELTPKQREKELQRLATEFEMEVKSGNSVNTNITFEKFVDQWIVQYGEKNLEKTTLESYKGELRTKILPAIGHVKLKELRPLHIINFLHNLTEDGVRIDGKPGGYSTRIIKYQHSIISSILQTAVYWQILNENIARRVQPPKGIDVSKGDNFLDDEQAESFLMYVLETEPLIYQAMAFVAAYGGLRKGEILGLSWADVIFAENIIRITKAFARADKQEFIKGTKNKSSVRDITLPSIVMRLLKEYKLQSDSPVRVFPLSYSVPTQWFRRVRNSYNATHEAKIPEKMTFHGLRHTSASLLLSNNIDIKSVSSRMGHADTMTTGRIYAHFIKKKDTEMANRLEDVIGIGVKRKG